MLIFILNNNMIDTHNKLNFVSSNAGAEFWSINLSVPAFFVYWLNRLVNTSETRAVSPYQHQSFNNESVSLLQWNHAVSSISERVASTAIVSRSNEETMRTPFLSVSNSYN